MNTPSIQRMVKELQCTEAKAKSIKWLMTGKLDLSGVTATSLFPESMAGTVSSVEFKRLTSWLHQCYNEPPTIDKVLFLMNEILGTHGVEAVYKDGVLPFDVLFEYLNTGSSYSPTILYFPQENRFRIGSWGDAVERYGCN